MNFKKYSALALTLLQTTAVFAADDTRLGPKDERLPAYTVRVQQAATQTVLRPAFDIDNNNSGDETNVANYAGQFSKLLDHDLSTGILTPTGQLNYQRLLKAVASGNQADYNAIVRAAGTLRLFDDPQSACAFSLEGEDTSLYQMPPPPSVTSAEGAADMIEVYLKMVCRDVNFSDYGTGLNTDNDGHGGSLTNKAALVLDDLGAAYHGPRNGGGHVDATVLFRGTGTGSLVGPYISQFLLQPVPPAFPSGCGGPINKLNGLANLPLSAFMENQLYPTAQLREFGVSWADFAQIENGLIPKKYASTDYSTNLRYMINGRDGGSYVHFDGLYLEYFNAIQMLAGSFFPTFVGNPYGNGDMPNEYSGQTLGGGDALGAMGNVAIEALKAAFAEKWRASRRLRPEAMAGLVHIAKTTSTNPYNLHPSLFALHNGIDYLAMVLAHNQLQAQASYDPQQLLTLLQASTYLLGQMYPEASPAHPSYPAGHAVVAGACVTVIKAFFNDQTLINAKMTPMKVNPANPTQLIPLPNGEGANVITVGGELDKLASNIALFRNFAGVHYRNDGDQGILLGEQVAIAWLQDRAATYQEQDFVGFQLTKRDGTRIQITANAVTNI